MQNVTVSRPVFSRCASTVRQSLGDETSNDRLVHENQVDRQFMDMLGSYRCNGGLARAQEVFTLFKSRHGADPATLARWIVRRSVISFDWQSKVWIPLFQFNRSNMTLHPGIIQVLAALNPVFGPWELANWFSQPNQWLNHCSPADTFSVDEPAVLRAACADRFIAD